MFNEYLKHCDRFKNSDIPGNRLIYLNCLKDLALWGKKLNKISPDKQIEKTVDLLNDKISKYTLYPKLNRKFNIFGKTVHK